VVLNLKLKKRSKFIKQKMIKNFAKQLANLFISTLIIISVIADEDEEDHESEGHHESGHHESSKVPTNAESKYLTF
jgi:hypothetical protein